MIELRPVSELGGADFGWLKALHHFHVGGHSNPAHKTLGNLYVWNDDDIAPGMGFPLHRHRDVEIITYVRQGRILHRDSLGNVGQIASGDVQVMSAGTGIAHEEVAMPDQWARVFQIWLQPRERGDPPRWGTRSFPKAGRVGRLVTLASGFAEDVGALPIRTDARVLGASLSAGQRVSYSIDDPERKAYVVTTGGRIVLNGLQPGERDGAAIRGERALEIEALSDTEIVLVDTM